LGGILANFKRPIFQARVPFFKLQGTRNLEGLGLKGFTKLDLRNQD